MFWKQVTELAQSDKQEDQELADKLIEQYDQTTFNGKPFSILHSSRKGKFTRELLDFNKKTRELEKSARKSLADEKIREMLVSVGPNGTKEEYGDIIRYAEKMYASFGEIYDH